MKIIKFMIITCFIATSTISFAEEYKIDLNTDYTSKITKRHENKFAKEEVVYHNDKIIATIYYNNKGITTKTKGKIPDNVSIKGYSDNFKQDYYTVYDKNKLKHQVFYKNGTKIVENKYKNDKEVISTGFYETGEKQYVVKYINDKIEGLVKRYYKNGKLESKANYANGEYHGELVSYHENGKLEGKTNYVNGKLHGKFILYYENGNILEISNYKNGKIIDIIKYYEDGTKSLEGKYINDKFYGKSYNKDGSLDYETKSETIKVTADKICKDYEENEITAKQKYYGQYVEITGVIAVIEQDEELYRIGLENETYTTIYCYFKSKEKLLNLKKGQSITIKGFMNDWDNYKTMLLIVNCDI